MKLLTKDLTLDDVHEILQKPFESKDVVNNLYEAWHRLPACELMAVVGSAIQELQYYRQKELK